MWAPSFSRLPRFYIQDEGVIQIEFCLEPTTVLCSHLCLCSPLGSGEVDHVQDARFDGLPLGHPGLGRLPHVHHEERVAPARRLVRRRRLLRPLLVAARKQAHYLFML